MTTISKPGVAGNIGALPFLARFFQGTRHSIELRAIIPNGVSGRTFINNGESPLTVERFLVAHAHQNVYFGVATREGGGSKGFCREVTALWTEIDLKDLGGDCERAQSLIASFPLAPSLVVSSGGGFHLYWLLENPASALVQTIEPLLKSIASFLPPGCDRQVAELARVMRLPGTVNVKYSPPRPVSMVKADWDLRYAVGDFGCFAQTSFAPANGRRPAPDPPHGDGAAKIPSGKRHEFLLKRAGQYRRAGDDRETIYAKLKVDYELSCEREPESSDTELRDLAGWTAEKPAAAEPGGLLEQSLSDHGNAQRLVKLYGEDLRYCSLMKKFLMWDGRRWRIDELDSHRLLIQNCMVEFVRQAVETPVAKFAAGCLNTKRISSALTETQPIIAVSPAQLDRDPWLLNFLNGTLDLRTLVLRAHSREDRITKLVHCDYNPEAQAPRFLAFLNRIVESTLIPHLQKALGYSVTGVTSEKKAFLCLGPTDSGKTTLLNLVRDLFDEYATLILVDTLMQKNEDNNSRADLADLRGCRFAMTSETEEGQRLREAKLKRITQGQGRIKSVRKYENPIEFAEQHHLWIDANHRPLVHGTDDAIWSRLWPFPFDHPLDKSEIDPKLPAKLRAEAEGVVAWIVDGAKLWQTEGLGELPGRVESTRSTWRAEMDRLAAFREECCQQGPEFSNQARPLYKRYREWCEEAGERPVTETMFGRRMTEAGFRKETGAVVTYIGIAIKDLFHV